MKSPHNYRTLACWLFVPLLVLSLAFLVGRPSRATGNAPPTSTVHPALILIGGEVRGTIFALTTDVPITILGDQIVFLPDVSVFLQNTTKDCR